MECKCWTNKTITTLICEKCKGYITFIRVGQITEEDSDQTKLKKLKKQLQHIRENLFSVEADINELEHKINVQTHSSSSESSESSDDTIEDEYTIKNVEKVCHSVN